MNELELKVQEAEANVARLEAEYASIGDRRTELKNQLEKLESRQRRLLSPFSRRGLITDAKHYVEDAKRALVDATARTVIWLETPQWSGSSDYIVFKVTPKRVYIRKRGGRNEAHRDKETGKGRHEWDGVIDIAATFPEGVENFKP